MATSLKIFINLDNAAFDPPNRGAEIARILRKFADFADTVEYVGMNTSGRFAVLRDINGNYVGEAILD